MGTRRFSGSRSNTAGSKRKSHQGTRTITSKSSSSKANASGRSKTSQSIHEAGLTAAEKALDEENEVGNEDNDPDDDDDEDAENDTDSIFERLRSQFSPEQDAPGETPETTGTNSRRSLRSSNAQAEEVFDTVQPTIDNYKDLVDKWPPARIAVQDRLQKRKRTAVPPKILTKARAIQKLYKQHKSLLAIMGNFSTFTMDKALGELGGRRRPSGYQIWLKFGKEIEEHRKRMPRKWGQKGVLASRNKILGNLWTALPASHREVLSPPVFHALSGLSYSQHGKKLEDDEEQEKDVIEFEPGKREELQLLYDQIVWKEKVAKEYSKARKGIATGPTLPDYNRQSLKCIERLNNQIEDESQNMGFDYYLLACSNHSSTEVGSYLLGWSREYTTLDEMAKYVNKKSNFATMFGERAQGCSVGEVVAETIGGNNGISTGKARKTDPGDKVKSDLAFALRTSMKELLGYEVGFPRGPDPEVILLDKGYGIKIIQLPGSKLPYETLKVGFNSMNSHQSLWLEDVQANLFKLEKITSPDFPDEDDKQMDIDEEVTNTQDVTIDDEVDDGEEWGGIGIGDEE